MLLLSGRAENHLVTALRCAQRVEIQLVLIGFCGEFTAVRFVIAGVEKTFIAQPIDAGELYVNQR